MENKQIHTSLTVLITLAALLIVIFSISQDEMSIGMAEKILYMISTLLLFGFLASAFMKENNMMLKLSLFYNMTTLIVLSINLQNMWMPIYIRIPALLAVLFSSLWNASIAMNHMRMEKEKPKGTIRIIDMTRMKSEKRRRKEHGKARNKRDKGVAKKGRKARSQKK